MLALALAAIICGVLGVIIGVSIGVQRSQPESPSAMLVAPPTTDSAPLVAMLERLPIGIVLCDGDGALAYRNATARALAGTHAGVLLDAALERHLAAAVTETVSEEFLELYGPPKMALVVRAAALDGGGTFAFIEDISERRRIDSIRTDFVANISHELKTPVGALAVLAETLVDAPSADVVAQLAERLLTEAHRASRTIDDLLELSEIELGSDDLFDDLDAAEVLAVAVERVVPLADQNAVVLDATIDRPVMMRGHRRQLVSAVGNLVENAVKYSEAGDVVRVGVDRRGSDVEFIVADEGVGIPARDLDRIFERFYRVDRARSRGTGGSGLGLAIVRHVATNHDGEVTVTSTEGQGSTFALRVPARRSATGERAPLESDTGRPTVPTGLTGPTGPTVSGRDHTETAEGAR